MACSAKSGVDCRSKADGRKARAPGRRGNVVRRSIVFVLMIEAPRVYAALNAEASPRVATACLAEARTAT